MRVRFKKLTKKAHTPTRGSQYSAGWDLKATSIKKEKDVLTYGTGLSIEIPEGYFAIIAARPSVYRTDLSLTNSLGIISCDDTGEIVFKYRILSQGDYPKTYRVGDKIGQLVILSHAAPEWCEAEIIGP